MGHSRGGLSARAFLQNSSNATTRAAVIGVLTTGSPHLGSRIARIYEWLRTHPRGAVGTESDDWDVVDLLLAEGFDVRRPVIGDLTSDFPATSTAIATLNAMASVQNLPTHIRYGEIVYNKAKLGWLAREPVNFNVFGSGINPGEQLSQEAQVNILGVGKSAIDYPGDGLIPGPGQVFTSLPGFSGVAVSRLVDATNDVLHTEEPTRTEDLNARLRAIVPTWFP